VTQCYVEYSKAITRRYVEHREVLLDTNFEKLRAMLHSAESRLRAMQVKINSLISARNLNRIRKYFRVFIRALGAINLWKKWRSKISWDCLFKRCYFPLKKYVSDWLHSAQRENEATEEIASAWKRHYFSFCPVPAQPNLTSCYTWGLTRVDHYILRTGKRVIFHGKIPAANPNP
jgi:hypothetical protein